MSSADFPLYKPLQLSGAVSFSRPSVKNVYDRAGTLVEVPANVLGLTYDPADLTRGPAALIGPEATNYSPNSTLQGAAAGTPGTLPTGWFASTNVPGLTRQILGRNFDSGIEFVDIRIFGTVGAIALPEYTFQFTNVIPAAADQVWSSSVFARVNGGPTRISQLQAFEHYIIASKADGTIAEATAKATAPTHTTLRDNRLTYTRQIKAEDTVSVVHRLDLNLRNGGNYELDVTVRIGLPQLERDRVTSPIRTSSGAVTRAADVVGAGAGLVYSSVAITEPLWVAGTYAQGATVRDSDNFVFESLASSNSAPLTEKTKWLPLGKTNQLKMFDKAVNSQTTAPDSLTVVVKPGQLANTLTLLNIAGAEVTVTQSESGYARQQALATHNVLSWYDFYYQEPRWIGDTVFADMPPYLNSLITVHVKSPGNIAGLGGFFLGRPKFIGKTQWGLKAGILSYSSQEADTFGNVTLMKRASAKKMNFEVAVPRGYEDEVYRFMTAADNEEMIAIASTNWAMTLSYGYLGQWELPLGIEGEKMPVEWRGLI